MVKLCMRREAISGCFAVCQGEVTECNDDSFRRVDSLDFRSQMPPRPVITALSLLGLDPGAEELWGASCGARAVGRTLRAPRADMV